MSLGGIGARLLGIGVDLCDIRRIARALERFDERFLERVYSEAERAICDRRGARRLSAYAARWAGKEACAKALGVGFRGFGPTEIEVLSGAAGAPRLRLSGGAASRLQAITPPGAAARLHVSLSDEPPYAQAFVMIEAISEDAPPPPVA